MNFKQMIKDSKYGTISIASTILFLLFFIIGYFTNKAGFSLTQGFHPKIFYIFPIIAIIFRIVSKKKDDITFIKKVTFFNLFFPIGLTLAYTALYFNNTIAIVLFCFSLFIFMCDAISSFFSRKESLNLFLGVPV